MTPDEEPATKADATELQRLQQEREHYVTRIFWFALEIALIFLLPALLVVFIAGSLWSKEVVWYILPFSFILSWVIIGIRYKRLHTKLSGLDKQIKALKEKK